MVKVSAKPCVDPDAASLRLATSAHRWHCRAVGHEMQKFDAIIIGTGQAGPPLAARLVDAGMKIAVIERKFFGGTCVNTGCIPTKSLIASAYAGSIARRAGDFGVRVGEVSVDMKAVKARKDAISGQSRTAVERWMKGLKSCTVYQDHARLLSPRE